MYAGGCSVPEPVVVGFRNIILWNSEKDISIRGFICICLL